MRVLIDHDPFVELDEGKDWISRGVWPCRWIRCKGAVNPPFVTAYRRRFTMPRDATVRVHVSADERYELFLDGERIGRGSERGDRGNWFYETHDLDLEAGRHVIVARVWSLGSDAPYAQMSVGPGFILATEVGYTDLLGTGVAKWEAKKLGGYEFTDPAPAWGTGANVVVDGSEFPWEFEAGEGDGWKPVEDLREGANGFIRNEYRAVHLMKPATLPPMIENEVFVGTARFVSEAESVKVDMKDNLASELDQWNLIRDRNSVTVPAHTKRRVIIDLENYYCAYPEVVTSGGKGSAVRLLWAESLYEQIEGGEVKGNRDEIEGKYFWGVGDTFKPDGGFSRRFDTLWWQAGRYIEVYVETADEPLTINSLKLRETRYPLEMDSSFQASDPRLERATPIALRALQMCSHETYIDCPYYEQLQYVGDARLEALANYTINLDDRLARKALRMFDVSRISSGLTQSRYPSRVTQIIPPFSLWWVGMVYDYALWRDDQQFVRSLMPGVRAVIDNYLGSRNKDGLIQAPNGWNFMDWVGWLWGTPPGADFGVNAIMNWQMVLLLTMVAELEESIAEHEMAARARRLASELSSRVTAAFWDDSRNLFADDLSKEHFSEHAQCLAVLSGRVGTEKRTKLSASLVRDRNLDRTTISFSHYLFEAYRSLGQADALFDRLGMWFDLEPNGFKTTFEMPEPTRSDCHGWGAHLLYHYFATILGIRPGTMGFRSVTIVPHLGPLTSAKGKLVHPMGLIEADLTQQDGVLGGTITLPNAVNGVLVMGARTQSLRPGRQEIRQA